MGNYNRDDRGSRGGGFSRGRSSFGDRGGSRGGGFSSSRGAGSRFARGSGSFGRDDSGPREMFDAVCDNCGKACQVPFRPTSGKPVYCSDCFEKMGGRDARPERQERPRPDFNRPQAPRNDGNSAQLEAINAKLDKLISLLEPKIKKEVFVAPIVEKAKEVKTPKVKKVKKVTSEE